MLYNLGVHFLLANVLLSRAMRTLSRVGIISDTHTTAQCHFRDQTEAIVFESPTKSKSDVRMRVKGPNSGDAELFWLGGPTGWSSYSHQVASAWLRLGGFEPTDLPNDRRRSRRGPCIFISL